MTKTFQKNFKVTAFTKIYFSYFLNINSSLYGIDQSQLKRELQLAVIYSSDMGKINVIK